MTPKARKIFVIVLIFLALSFLSLALFPSLIPDKYLPLLATYGGQISKQRAEKLESHLISRPNNFADRVELLGFYWNKRITGELTPEDIRARRSHILWVIKNHPASAVAGDFTMEFYPGDEDPDPQGREEAKNLWIQQTNANPSNARILYNAGMFFFSTRDVPVSETYFERARAIDADSFDITNSLATDYWHDARYAPNSDEVHSSAIKASRMFDYALKDASGKDQRRLVLPDAAQAAFEAGDYSKASAFANEMLKIASRPEEYRNYSDETHYGNIVLGRIALAHGDTDEASSDLIKAAAIKGDPHLDTFGPNMMLAKELLDRGDNKSVINYLELCSLFWKEDDGKLARWQSDIAKGNVPDFGPNLHY